MARKPISELREEMRAVARGERKASPLPAAKLLSTLTVEALELLQIISNSRPVGVQELAELTGRSQPNISRSLQLLAKQGLLRLVRTGREVHPEPLAREVRIDLRTGTCQKMPLVKAGTGG
jgi:predicted transcriptional regulator